MNIDFYLSFIFLALSSLIILRIFYLIIIHSNKIFKVSYLTEITVLTGLAIAIGSHETIHLMFKNKYGFSPISIFFN
jgi:hypothetical protein